MLFYGMVTQLSMWAYRIIIKMMILVFVSFVDATIEHRSSMASGFIITFILMSFVDEHCGIIFSSNECVWQWEAMDRSLKVAIGVSSHGISCRRPVDFRWDPLVMMKAAAPRGWWMRSFGCSVKRFWFWGMIVHDIGGFGKMIVTHLLAIWGRCSIARRFSTT